MSLICFFILVNIIVVALFILIAKWSHSNTFYNFDEFGVLWFFKMCLIAIGNVWFWFEVNEVIYNLFDMKKPVCIEHVATVDVLYHWSSPQDKYFIIPDGIHKFKLEESINFNLKKITMTPGDEIYLSDFYINDNLNTPQSSLEKVHIFIYEYKKWHGFEIPKSFRRGFVSYEKPSWYEEAKCKETVELGANE